MYLYGGKRKGQIKRRVIPEIERQNSMKNYFKSFLFPILGSAMYFVAYKQDVAFFQVLSWVFGIPMFIFSIVALFITEKQWKNMSYELTPLKKFSLVINSSLFATFDLWATKGSQFFWLVLAIFVNSVIALVFNAPNKKEE